MRVKGRSSENGRIRGREGGRVRTFRVHLSEWQRGPLPLEPMIALKRAR